MANRLKIGTTVCDMKNTFLSTVVESMVSQNAVTSYKVYTQTSSLLFSICELKLSFKPKAKTELLSFSYLSC